MSQPAMDPPCSLYVLVPMLNEAPNLPTLIASMRSMAARLPPHITPRFLIIDDGSTDGTGESALSLSAGLDVTVLRHESRRGPGGAFATGFTHLARFLGLEAAVEHGLANQRGDDGGVGGDDHPADADALLLGETGTR